MASEVLPACRPSDRLWIGVFVGVAAVFGLGGLVLALLARRSTPAPAPTPVPVAPVVNNYIVTPSPTAEPYQLPVAPATPLPVSVSSVVPANPQGLAGAAILATLPVTPTRRVPLMKRPPVVKTVLLPPLTAASSVMIFATGELPAMVVVRTINPPGGYAAIAFDPNQLASLTPVLTSGDVLIIPAGQDSPVIRVGPRQALYGKGNLAGVAITLSAADLDE
jgi:hypothetical protein